MAEANVERASKWNSLELTKVIIGVLTPAAITYFAFTLQSSSAERAKSEAQAQARATRVVEARAALWQRLVEPLNDMYVYTMQVGHWQELSYDDIITRKRQTDRIVHANYAVFSPEFFASYRAFTDAIFETWGGYGTDAKIKAFPTPREATDTASFRQDLYDPDAIHRTYYNMLGVIATELDLVATRPSVPRRPEPEGSPR
ncbi:MAG TPA: hypothetical protein VGB79_10045 [Allosphingosinicella sp.]|jgi:hypothetical protein